MTHILNPITGEVRYVTKAWARWLKSYGWLPATFEQFMAYQLSLHQLTAYDQDQRRLAPPLRLHDL